MTAHQIARLGAVECSWCGIRDATGKLYGADTCTACASSDRKFRVQAYLQRLKRATGAP